LKGRPPCSWRTTRWSYCWHEGRSGGASAPTENGALRALVSAGRISRRGAVSRGRVGVRTRRTPARSMYWVGGWRISRTAPDPGPGCTRALRETTCAGFSDTLKSRTIWPTARMICGEASGIDLAGQGNRTRASRVRPCPRPFVERKGPGRDTPGGRMEERLLPGVSGQG
jgi:hypothetical protein